MTTRISRGALACALLATTCLAAPALAQTASPTFRNLDANGVDLTSGDFLSSFAEGSIGSGDAELTLLRMIGNHGSNGAQGTSQWDHILLNVIQNSGAYVDFGARNDKFPGAESRGATLSGGGDSYSYRAPDGTVIAFSDPNGGSSDITNFCDGSGTQSSCILLPTSIRSPDGRVVDLDYEFWTLCIKQPLQTDPDQPPPPTDCTYTPRLSRVSNSDGYAIEFSYASGAGGGSSNPPASFHQRTGATFHNSQAGTAPLASVSYAYPSAGVTDITDTGGRSWRVTSGSGTLAVRRPGAGADSMAVAYDPATGRVSSVIREGVATRYARSVSGATATMTVTDALDRQTVVTSDLGIGRPVSVRDALQHVTRFEYEPGTGRLSKTIAPEGNVVQLTYDGRGNVTRTDRVAKDGVATISSFARFPDACANFVTCNQPLSTTDARGQVTDYAYDETHGGLISVTAPAPAPGAVRPQTRYSYTLLNGEYRLTGVSACRTGASCAGTADEVKTAIGYDANGNVTSTSSGAGDNSLVATETTTYDARGDLTSVDGPLPGAGDTVRYRYNAARERVGTVSPDPDPVPGQPSGPLKHRAVRTTIDHRGLVTRQETGTVADQSDAAWSAFAPLEAVETDYDANFRPVTQRLVAAGTIHALTQTSYDALGRPDCTAQRMDTAEFNLTLRGACTADPTPGSFGPDRISRSHYDPLGRVERVQTGLGTTEARDEVRTTYTPNGQVETLTDAENNRTTYQYDGHDRLAKTVYPLAQKGANASNPNDYEQLAYDAASNVTSRRLRDGNMLHYGYDALGRLASHDRPGGEPDVSYSYDNLGRLREALDMYGHKAAFAYDALGRKTSEGNFYYSFTSHYDLAGRRTRLTGTGGYDVSFTHLVTGEMREIVDGHGVAVTFGYDDLGRRKSLTRANGTVTSYGYDPVSRLASLAQDLAGTAGDVGVTFDYNPASQIASSTRSNDAFGWAGGRNESTGYAANGLNQLTQAGTAAPTYDARGSTTFTGSATYAYDSHNKLVYVNGQKLFYYEPLGRMIHPADTSLHLGYDGSDLVAEYSSNGFGLVRAYVHGPGVDEPLISYENGHRRFLHADERGSIVALSDDAGNLAAANRYDEYGRPDGALLGRFGYTGQVWLPEIGVYYYKERLYDPKLGRFLQTDTLGYYDGPNLYAYVGNDPVNFTDPLGLCRLESGNIWNVFNGNTGRYLGSETGSTFYVVKNCNSLGDLGGGSNRLRFQPRMFAEDGGGGEPGGGMPSPPEKKCYGPPAAPGTRATPSRLAALARSNAAQAGQHRTSIPIGTLLWFRSMVRNKGPWDYKQYGRSFENFGNYNYGYAGTAAGIRAGVLLRQAGRAQVAAGTSKPEWGTPGTGVFGGSGSFGDDPLDQAMIKRGIEDRRNGC